MADVKDTLKQLAIQIRDEHKVGANTAKRVGSLLAAMIDLDVDIEELSKYFLRKDIPNTAQGLITFLAGLTSEELIIAKSGLVVKRNEIVETFVEEGEDVITEIAAEQSNTLGQLINVLADVDDINDNNVVLAKNAKENVWRPVELDVIGNNLSQFVEITPSLDSITIDFSKTPYSLVSLSGSAAVFNLSIINIVNGGKGQILVSQTGFKQIAVSSNIIGTVDIPLNANTIALLSYNCIGDTIYIHTDTVIGDIQFPAPQRIVDFQTVYFDSDTCIVTWTAPYANNIYDDATEYDMRYSHSLINADDPKIWSGLSQIKGVPDPSSYGSVQRFSISGLESNKEYYIYLKSVKVNYGVRYISQSSDPAYCKTKGDPSLSEGTYRLHLNSKMLYPRRKDGWKDDAGVVHGVSYITDEDEKNVFLEDGRPNISERPYETFWRTPSNKYDNPYNFLIELNQVHELDTLYIMSWQKASFRVFIIKDVGYAPEYVCTSSQIYNGWEVLSLAGKQARFINLVYDVVPFAENEPNVVSGEECYPTANQGNLLGGIYKMFVYGRYLSNKPNYILPPARNTRKKHSFDEFLCTNGHFYQQGRIHSMCSGSHVRLYGALGHFGPPQFTDNYQRIADYRVTVDKINWTYQNGGGRYLKDNLSDTFVKYGLKPFIAGTGIIDYCRWQGYTSGKDKNKCLDNYWLPDVWKALPTKGLFGTEKYFAATTNPENYKTLSKACNHILAVYGEVPVNASNLDLYPSSESTESGLGFMDAIEHINEPDATWLGWMWYMQPEECTAQLSAIFDGHCGTIKDEDNNFDKYGVKNINSNALVIMPGMAGLNTGYVRMMYLWAKRYRKDGKFPCDVLNFHSYFSNIGNQGGDSTIPVQYAITCEESLNNEVGGEFFTMADFRNRYLSDKEIWITEFGYGECGGLNTQSKYQCYTQAGRQIGTWIIPDRHRSDVKGAWTIRAVLTMMRVGFDMCHYYSTEMESSYFDAGQWGAGAGYEMFHWNDCTDETPGAKAAAIKSYEHSYPRGGFSLTGLFGPLLNAGAFPISRAYWWIATYRNRLRGYVYTGLKYIDRDERIMVFCFRKQNEEKGAYVIYLNDSQNTGIPNVEVPIPDGVDFVEKISVWIPELVSPETIPSNWAEYDQCRTQFPTSRREKYINGAWVVQNEKVDGVNYESFSNEPAVYPSNPTEGDMVTVIPSIEENPFFPIVGPVGSKYSIHGKNPGAQEYEWIDPNDPVNDDGTPKWSIKYNNKLAWRQVDAVCDFIEFTESGKHGVTGDTEVLQTLRGCITINISEFPEIFLFDAVPDPDFKSEVTDLTVVPVNSTSVKLYWNNHNTEDTGYEIFVSSLPETGYSKIKEVSLGVENEAVVSGLSASTSYYFKMRPMCGAKAGTLSAHTSTTTYSFLPSPFNLQYVGNATSIILTWNYIDELLPDFVHYAIYRSNGDGNFVLVGKVEDRLTHTYTDLGLSVGTSFIYKVRAVGLNGQSEYSSEINARTLAAEECSPTLQTAMTDKLGTKIILTFDLPIAPFDTSFKELFTLTEDGNQRLILYASIDESDSTRVIIKINSGSLSDYDKKTLSYLSYTAGTTSFIQSAYGVKLNSFSVKVINLVGNFTDLEATYKINFSGTEEILPISTEWNNFIGVPETGSLSLNNIKDTYGRSSSVKLMTMHNPPTLVWGGAGQNSGSCGLEDVEPEVYKTAWLVAYRALVSENIVARIKLYDLSPERKYTIKAYASWNNTSSEVPYARIKCAGVYSNIVALTNNKTSFMLIEDCIPDSEGVLLLDFLPMREAVSTAVPFNFFIIEEYKSNDEPTNNDVWVRSINIVEDTESLGVIYNPSIHVYFNCVGVPTEYRIAESEEALVSSQWVSIPEDYKAPYTVSSEYGSKTLFCQARNSFSESNIRNIAVEYRDPYVPLVLTNVFINNDDSSTYSKNVTLFVEKQGVPTHYRVSETSDLSSVSWVAWPVESSTIPFVLSDTGGQKSVYLQLKDSITESGVKVDTIQYVELTYTEVTLNIPISGNISTSDIDISFAPLKYNKRFAYGITSDDSHVSAWNIIFKYLNGMWIDDAIYFHMYDVNGILKERTTGAYAPRALTYTDGLGVKRRFPINVNVDFNPAGPINPDDAGGVQYPYLLYPEIKEILEFDGEFSLHDVKDPDLSSYGGTVENIVRGINYYQQTAVSKLGRKTLVMTEPNGDSKYTTGAELVPDIRMITSARGGFDVVNLKDATLNYDKLKVFRQFNETPTNGAATWKEEFLSRVSDGSYFEFGCHGTDKNKAITESAKSWPNLSEFLDWVCDTYGENGSDDIWFTTNGEVIQYKALCKMTNISHVVADSTLKITLNVPVLDNFNWKEFTLLVGGISGGTITESSNVKGLSSGILNNVFMINLNLDETLVTRAEKYTSLFESSLSADSSAAALYFIQRLKPSLRSSYLDRISIANTPPVLSEFGIYSTTPEGTDTPNITFYYATDERETHYMVSESSTFEGAQWVAISGSPNQSFTLSNVQGNHTVYFKVKNNAGESSVKFASIYYQPIAVELLTVSIVSREEAVLKLQTTFTGIPLYYRIAETSAGISSASWQSFVSDIYYTYSDLSDGTHYVFIQLKDQYENLSSIKSQSFTIYSDNYVKFEDSVVGDLIINKWGDGTGIKIVRLNTITTLDSLFTGNTSITSFNEFSYFTGYTATSWNVFSGCTSLVSITLPHTLSTLYGYMFYNCSSLKNINLEFITTLQKLALGGSGITEAILPSAETLVGDSLANCNSLTKLMLGNNCTIPSYFCTANPALSHLDLGSGINSINNCFNNSPLSEVIVRANTPPNLVNSFAKKTASCKFYVPDTSVDSYKAAAGWSSLASSIYPLSTLVIA